MIQTSPSHAGLLGRLLVVLTAPKASIFYLKIDLILRYLKVGTELHMIDEQSNGQYVSMTSFDTWLDLMVFTRVGGRDSGLKFAVE